MKTKFLLILFAIFIVNISSCNMLKPQSTPTVSVKDVKLKGISLNDMTFNVVLDIYNPYPVGGYIKALNWGVDIEKANLFKTQSTDRIGVKANSHADNPFDVKIKYTDLYRIVSDYGSRKSVNMVVKGDAVVDVPSYGDYTLPFSKSMDVPTVKLAMDVANFTVGSPKVHGDSLGGILGGSAPKVTQDVSFDYKLRNLTGSALKFSNLKLDLVKGATTLMQGVSGSPVSSGTNESTYRIKNTVNLVEGITSLSGNSGSYNYKGSFDIDLGPLGVQTVNFLK